MKRTRTIGSAALAAIVAAFVVSACGGSSGDDTVATKTTAPAPKGPPIVIGTKNFTEEFILGELYSQALRANGFAVTLKSNIGSSEVTHQALANHSLDMYPEYVGTLLSEIADDTKRYASPAVAYARAKHFEEAEGFTLLGPTPFSDSNALAVLPTFAKRHHVDSIADLKRLKPTVRIGAPKEFGSRFEGLYGLAQEYGLRPRYTKLDFGARYPSLDSGKVDVAAVFTTERQLAGSRYAVLADPQRLFATQHVAPIISRKAITLHGARLRRVIDAVSAKLTTAAMRRMNGAVDIDGRKPRDVAAEFLRSQALV